MTEPTTRCARCDRVIATWETIRCAKCRKLVCERCIELAQAQTCSTCLNREEQQESPEYT